MNLGIFKAALIKAALSDQESSQNSKSSASHDSRSEESERSEFLVSEMSCEWMFEGFWYFRNKYGLLPNEEIEEDKFDEIWE